jgi:nucleotide-binding universal stress UspA family protein
MRYILAGFNGSDSSMQAVLYARDRANKTAARLQVLTVAAFPAMGLDAYMDNIMEQQVSHCEQLIESLKRRLGSNETTQLILRAGNPAFEIVKHAMEYGVGQIVVGSRRHWFGRLPVSHVVRQIVAGAPCVVTVVKDRRGARRWAPGEPVVRESSG